MNKGVALTLILLAAACTREQPAGVPRVPDNASATLPEKSNPEQRANDAVARLEPTQGNTVSGTLALAQSAQGVRITGAVQGLKPDAAFGFHVHEKGDCSAADASSAGGHFNPTQQQHGDPSGAAHHAGDMVNIQSNAEGIAQVDTTAAGTTLRGDAATEVLGKAIVVHESPDDYATQPSGNSGKRIACGVITAAN